MGMLMAQEKCCLVLNELYILNIARYIKGQQWGQAQSVLKRQRLTPLALRIPRGGGIEEVKAVEHPAQAQSDTASAAGNNSSLGREPRHPFTPSLQGN